MCIILFYYTYVGKSSGSWFRPQKGLHLFFLQFHDVKIYLNTEKKIIYFIGLKNTVNIKHNGSMKLNVTNSIMHYGTFTDK